ncbi:MAG TPA: protein-disulfide reductase DsbD [Candidatus Thiothrix moscowensis]|uniref:protein-disulfide reductase DsbD n=1 Tax=unclassified Thiothrix TaxID=2636184 RepID=UPI0025CBFD9B|nr:MULTISPECIES: protein-disulfide reductase DsbD [unclassified Thiothrix]HRJ53518.1 protein-disulfide reductase DsbD [Candidatus Thiothrix moscowensis]HRJ93674.1 protein-disulfide reductase DsbD [Candidatus Thiothrix moscowensis]
MAEPAGLAAIQAVAKGTDDSFDFGEDGSLSSEEAFALGQPVLDEDTLRIQWVVAPEHYLYKDKFLFKVHEAKGLTVGEPQLPSGKVKQDEFFGTIEALYDLAEIRLPVQRTESGKAGSFVLELGWQGCAENVLCYPAELKAFKVSLAAPKAGEQTGSVSWEETTPPIPVASAVQAGDTFVSEQDQVAATLASGNTLLTLLGFLGFGLLLAFTPCVFPMIPILSGIIVGQKDLTPRKAFFLSLAYVLAMALTYTVAGVLAGMFGQNLQAMFQNPWILGVFSAIFVLLALSMFGFYDLQMPSSIQTRLNNVSNRQEGGSLIGVGIMGALSALIVGPCVAAPLAGALIYIGQTGDALLGGMALFALSIGMGIPLLLVGTSAGKWLPRAGMWMDAIKGVFGVMLLAVAIWMLERILPESVALLLWAALFVISAMFLGALTHLPEDSSGWRKFWKGTGILLLLYGSLLMVGSATGSGGLWQPLKGLSLGQGGGAAEAALPFQTVKSLEELQQSVKDAKGQPVMVDFYADWCVTCKEMEKYTFPDPAVQAQLRNVILLKADVTENSAQAKALLAHFKIPGPPAILFFNKDGTELRQFRQVGFMPAAAFAAHVSKALQ